MIHHHSSGKRGLWKRIFSMCIALVLICGVTVPASSVSASEATDGTVQVQEEQTLKNDNTQPSDVPKAGGEEETEEQTPGTGGTEEGTDSSVPEATYNFLVEGEVYAAQTVKDGETLSEPAAPEAEGKTFDGWYTAETGGEKFTAFGVQTVTETKTVDLYAGWQEAQDSEEEPGTDEGTTLPSETTEETVPGEENGETTQPADTTGEQEQNGNDEEIPLSNANGLTGATNANGGTSTLSISGPETVEVGQSITLKSNRSGRNYRNHEWTANLDGIVQLGNVDGTEISVTGVREGQVTITHTYEYYISLGLIGWWEGESEKYSITVTAASQPGTYSLYAYTLIPGVAEGSSSNADNVWNGMGVGRISGVDSPTDLPVDTIIDDGYGNGNEQYSGAVITYPNETGYRHNVVGKIKNGDQVEIVETLENEPSYPRIYSDGKWYTYAAPDSENANKEGYYTIEWMRVIVADGANAGNNEYHEVVNDIKKGGEYTYHLDGVVYLNEKNRYNVEFRLKDVGENTFSIVDPEKYSKRVEAGYSISNLTRPEEHEPNVYPQTKTVDGITYTFSGWYCDEACTDPVNWETDTITQNTVFYARYTPQGQNITVTKDVTGGLGDVQKEFKFTYQIKNASGTVLDSGEFTLKDKDVNNSSSYPIQNVPVGSTLIITETNAGGYFTSTKYNGENIIAHEGKDSEEKNLEIPIVNGKGDIVITNNKEPIPDTGVHLTSLPYIMTLSFVLAGTAVITVNKYRRRDS